MRLAQSRPVKVTVFAGWLLLEPGRCREAGLELCEQAMARGKSTEQTMGQTEPLLAAAVQRLLNRFDE